MTGDKRYIDVALDLTVEEWPSNEHVKDFRRWCNRWGISYKSDPQVAATQLIDEMNVYREEKAKWLAANYPNGHPKDIRRKKEEEAEAADEEEEQEAADEPEAEEPEAEEE